MVPPFLSTPCKWQNNSQRIWLYALLLITAISRK